MTRMNTLRNEARRRVGAIGKMNEEVHQNILRRIELVECMEEDCPT